VHLEVKGDSTVSLPPLSNLALAKWVILNVIESYLDIYGLWLDHSSSRDAIKGGDFIFSRFVSMGHRILTDSIRKLLRNKFKYSYSR
jgi:hypothetical protein